MKSFINILAIAAIAGLAVGTPVPYHTDDFLHFYTLDEIDHYMEHLVEEMPEMVSMKKIGETSEGRDINALLISVHGTHDHHVDKPIIMVESGLHAREWIAPMASLYFIHMFTEHPDHQQLLEFVDLLFVPMANPDGYEYSHTTDRSWNKNRRTVREGCIGVDLNKNFDFMFQTSGKDTCDDNFSGLTAGSEAETQAIQNVIKAGQDKIKLYLSLQSFGNQILTPYNYAVEDYDGERRLMRLGYRVASAIRRVYNTSYRVGVGARLLPSPEFGTSSDYAFGAGDIPAAFTIKLPRGGDTGFEVPEDQLDHILTETWSGFLELVKLFVDGLNNPEPY